MAMTPEARVKQTCRKVLDSFGDDVHYFFPPANGYGRAGIPDIIVCAGGFFLAIECKAGKGTTTALQKRELELIEKAGGTAVVVREDGGEALRTMLASRVALLQKMKAVT